MLNDKYLNELNELLHLFNSKLKIDHLEAYPTIFKNITLLDLRIIRYVTQNDNVSIKDIRQKLDVPVSTLTSAINRLENKKIIKRIINYDDRRTFIIELTSHGKNIHKKHETADLEITSNIIKTLDSEEKVKSFIDLMTIIVENTDKN